MKGSDRIVFWLLITLSIVMGYFIFDKKFNRYSDLITFLSIMIGFKITSLSVLFNSPLKRVLFDRKIKFYGTELHRLKDFYKYSIIFEVLSVVLLFVIPERICAVNIKSHIIIIGRYLLVLPVLAGVVYYFYKIYNDLLKIFVHPTNN